MKRYQKILRGLLKAYTFAVLSLIIFIIVYGFFETKKTEKALTGIEEHEILTVEKLAQNEYKIPIRIEEQTEDYVRYLFDHFNIEHKLNYSQEKIIYVYGASTPVDSGGKTFPQYLDDMNKNWTVYNFGVPGLESNHIKDFINFTLNHRKKPDIVIVYMGHNDFTYRFPGIETFQIFYKIGFMLSPRKEQFGNSYWFERAYKGPLFKLLQETGLISFNDTLIRENTPAIVGRYKQNMDDIMRTLKEKNISTIIMTPISNLELEPYGDIDTATAFYDEAMHEDSYGKRIELLERARDAEIFTRIIRAKSGINEYLRSIDKEGISIFDLENTFKQKNFSFGDQHFRDRVHFRDETHKMVAEELNRFINDQDMRNDNETKTIKTDIGQ
ncbi:MAG: SGNH/GDSL hydrolase family protein [Nanoarchaeota archaeon]